jgi:thioredoxin-related protein
MKRRILSLLMGLFVVIGPQVSGAGETRDPGDHFFYQSFGDLREELATARNQGKRGIFVMFHNTECPWCEKMRTNVLNQVSVQDYFRKYFINLQIDTEGSEMVTDFDGTEVMEKDFALKHNRVRATPVFAYFDTSGKQLVKYTGATRNIDEFMWLGEYIVGEHYKTKRFAIYKRERQKAARSNS